ncbi:hypothetical protein I603_1087 [Erythrobacter dokdonensis DSW-74]|uniref:Uncharacterized protein n=1 Tax=Erythrobacter dokdonensis DSW-74 TaxID=1300349 RepID=A0A1A7BGM5_9SPHN|nr:hypothetical protein I603_1087 [Erythrobacter dokdonensis DSW-74]
MIDDDAISKLSRVVHCRHTGEIGISVLHAGKNLTIPAKFSSNPSQNFNTNFGYWYDLQYI